jgi:hypothetical protein
MKMTAKSLLLILFIFAFFSQAYSQTTAPAKGTVTGTLISDGTSNPVLKGRMPPLNRLVLPQ